MRPVRAEGLRFRGDTGRRPGRVTMAGVGDNRCNGCRGRLVEAYAAGRPENCRTIS